MFIERIVGELGDKRRWREHKARVDALPANHRATVQALERYLTYLGTITTGDVPVDPLMAMFDDLVDTFERAAAAGTPVRAIVGDDLVQFAESFLGDRFEGPQIRKERDQLLSAIERWMYEGIDRGLDKERRRLVKDAEVGGTPS